MGEVLSNHLQPRSDKDGGRNVMKRALIFNNDTKLLSLV